MAEKQDELSIFNKWKKTGDVQHFRQLYSSMKPLIVEAANKASYGSNLPQSAHEIYAAQNFYEALHRFDPGKGVPLQTFVYGAVHQKAKRLNYQYQNLGKISEPRAIQVGNYQREQANLQAELGRPPTPHELADRLGIGIKDVERLTKEIQKEYSLSGLEEQATIEGNVDEEILAYLYYELTPEQKLVYDYIFGKNGKPKFRKPGGKIDFQRIATTLGFSESKVRVLVAGIGKKYEKVAR